MKQEFFNSSELSFEWEQCFEQANGDVQLATQYLSNRMKEEHRRYLQSDVWKRKREKIINRDNYICQDCKEIIPKIIFPLFNKFLEDLKKISYSTLASEVHHLDYEYKQTDLEEKYCISLCNYCHRLRHAETSSFIKILEENRENLIIRRVWRKLLQLPKYIEEANKQHKRFIDNVTILPKEAFKEGFNNNVIILSKKLKEVKNGEGERSKMV